MSRPRLRADDGFTLVELLVVILILGVLAALSLALLLGQRTKAHDTHAKTAATTAAKAATAFGTDHGAFDALDATELVKVEKSLEAARNLQVEGAGNTVSVDSAAGTTYSVSRSADGELTRDCTPAGSGSCRDDLDAHGNRW
jgi:type IV pilus assembly protein PilA